MSPAKNAVQYRGWDERSESGITINMNYIESLVWHFVLEYRTRANGLEKQNAIRSILDGMSQTLQKQQKTIEDRLKAEQTIERINERVVRGKMTDEQGDRLIQEEQERMRELDQMMARCHIEIEQYKKQLEPDNIDLNDLDDEQKKRIIGETVKKLYIEKDGTASGRIIEIQMVGDHIIKVHMRKRGNYFSTFIISNGIETEMDFDIVQRFVRKTY
jgi:archaellum component FlaC